MGGKCLAGLPGGELDTYNFLQKILVMGVVSRNG